MDYSGTQPESPQCKYMSNIYTLGKIYLLCFVMDIHLPNSVRVVTSYREVFLIPDAANPVIPLKCKAVNNVPKLYTNQCERNFSSSRKSTKEGNA
jgi:hypothetical protein